MAFTQIYTVGFTHKSAEVFFGILRDNKIKQLVDVRLNNTSQLSAFAKKNDLAYFLKHLLGIDYCHEPLLAPTEDILKPYQKRQIDWAQYEEKFITLMTTREIDKKISRNLFEKPTVLLCSEATAESCHRRLVAEYLAKKWETIRIVHL